MKWSIPLLALLVGLVVPVVLVERLAALANQPIGEPRGYPVSEVLVFAALTAIPYVVLAGMALRLGRYHEGTSRFRRLRRGVLLGGLPMFLLTVGGSWLSWSATYQSAPGGSTAPLLQLALPVYGLLALGLGYWVSVVIERRNQGTL